MRRAAALALIATAIAGCGGKGGADGRGNLVWDRVPHAYHAPHLRNDRVVIGRVRNNSTHALRLVAARLQVRDASGRAVATSSRFLSAYAHGLYGALQQPSQLPQAELIRLGRIVQLAPGGTAPLWVAYRLVPGTKLPLRVDYGSGALKVPGST